MGQGEGKRITVVFEGRDGAGKGGTIKAITERVSPRVFRVVALPAPSDREKSHHAAYVAGANTTLEKLAEAREKSDFAAINQLQKNLAFHLSGHVLHSLFWRNMSPHGGGEPHGELADAVKESFGSVANLKAQLNEAALNVQGSGWGTLAWEPLRKRLVTEQVYDHQGNIGNGTVPLLVLDVWEHAYYLQYENVKGDWVRAFWKIVNWEDVRQRLQKVSELDLGL
jgi:superoxide dismutase, Fe-Mn family